MINSAPSQQYLQGHPLSAAAVVHAVLPPAAAIATLSLCAIAFQQSFTGPYLILAIIVFSVTFPGRLAHASNIWGMAINVISYWLLVVALLLFLGWTTQTLDAFDQRVIQAWIITTPTALLAVQLLMPIVLPRLMSTESARRVAIIAGGGQLGRQLAARIEASPTLGIQIAGFFEDRRVERSGASKDGGILGVIDGLAAYVKSHHVDLIYITLPMASQPRIVKLLDELRDTTASIYFTPDIFLSDLIQARVDTVAGMPVVAVCETPFYGIDGILKRASDLLLASLILTLIAPVMALIAGAIKIQSPGPAIFRQRRYGLDGREIVIYKFRSMTVAEDGNTIAQATRHDSRVTPLGAFLRRTSLDELPQFINVLQGRMSVVGPRPHAIAHNEMYRKLINGYMIRHKVRPGITGWAQINGHRGETDTLEKMRTRVDFDLAYLRNWSLAWDLEIIIKTLLVVVNDHHAY